MKPQISFILFFSLVLCNLQAQPQSGHNSLHEQLQELNIQWQNYPDIVEPSLPHPFHTEQSYIRYHLDLVERFLRTRETADLNTAQVKARIANLEALRTYLEAERFPRNMVYPNRRPCFIDTFGTACAVGHLIIHSGNKSLAQEIAKTENYAYLFQMKTPGLIDWQENSGLSVQELAWIQPAYAEDVFAWEQKPQCGVRYFDELLGGYTQKEKSKRRIWFSGECQDSILHGWWRQYHYYASFTTVASDSRQQVWMEGRFEQGKREGNWLRYNTSGKVTGIFPWEDGLKHGEWLEYEPGNLDQVRIKKTYQMGKLEGDYYQNISGIRYETGQYKAGLKEGLWTTFLPHLDGKLQKNDQWERGELRERTSFRTDGSVFRHLKWQDGYLADTLWQNDSTWIYTGFVRLSILKEPFLNMDGPPMSDMSQPEYYIQEVFHRNGHWKEYPGFNSKPLSECRLVHRWYHDDSLLREVRFDHMNGPDSVFVHKDFFPFKMELSRGYYATISRVIPNWRQVTYISGKPHNFWHEYYENGQPKLLFVYDRGRCRGGKIFRPDRSVIGEHIYDRKADKCEVVYYVGKDDPEWNLMEPFTHQVPLIRGILRKKKKKKRR